MDTKLNTSNTFNDDAVVGFGTEVTSTNALSKTPQSKNIDIAEWNKLVEAASRSEADVQRLYNVLARIFPNIDEFVTALAESSASKTYVNDELAKKVNALDVEDNGGKIARRKSNNQLTVPLQPEANADAASKKYVDDNVISGVSANYDAVSHDLSFEFSRKSGDADKININIPLDALKIVSIDDYLDDGGKRMLQLQFADGATITLEFNDIFDGIDTLLADKADKVEVENALAGKVDKLTPTDDALVYVESVLQGKTVGIPLEYRAGKIPRRDKDNQLDVPLIPVEDKHAVSKKYVDTTSATLTDSINVLNTQVETLEGLLIKRIVDDSESYTKRIPSSVSENIILNRLGGKSVKSGNLCEASDDDGLTFEVSKSNPTAKYEFELPYGTYSYRYMIEMPTGVSTSFASTVNFSYNGTVHMLPSSGTGTIVCNTDLVITFNPSFSGLTEDTVKVRYYLNIVEGTTVPTEYETYSKPTKVANIISRSKSVIPTPYMGYDPSRGIWVTKRAGYEKRVNGLYWHLEDYDRLIVKGTSTRVCYFTLQHECEIPKGTYTLTGCPNIKGCALRALGQSSEGKYNNLIAVDKGDGATFTLDETQKLQFNIEIYANVTLNSVIFAPNVASFCKHYPIPVEIQNKEGYGTDEGYIDFDRKQWVYNGEPEDISDILDYPKYKFLRVQKGGELVAENIDKNPVPWTITMAEAK